jgi:hypothetical protein
MQTQLRTRIQPSRFRQRKQRKQRVAENPQTQFINAMLRRFHARHNVLLGRYERLVRISDVTETRRDAVASQIRSLERAIAALEGYPKG